jgi:hypothetical protein
MGSVTSHLSNVDGLMGKDLFFIKSCWRKHFQDNGSNKKMIIISTNNSYPKNGRK